MIVHKKNVVPYTDDELIEFGNLFFENKLLMTEIASTPRNNEGIILNEYEIHALLFIENNPNITSIELAKIMRRDKSTVSPLVYRLSTEGFITKEVDVTNRRRHLLNITQKGIEACAIHRALDAKIMRRTVSNILEYCTIAEFEAFIKVTRCRNKMFTEQLDRDPSIDETQYLGC